MSSRYPAPAFNQVSALTALVLLSYGLIRMITLPSVDTEFGVLGLLVKVEFRTQSFMLILVAALAASGADWLIRNHPYFRGGKALLLEHWVLPALAAVAIGVVVLQIPDSLQLWVGLFFGALLLVGVLWAEFIVSFQRDPRFGLITIALNGLAFLLLTGSFFTVKALQVRVIFAGPIIILLTFMVFWRLFRLGFPRERAEKWGVLISLVAAQIAVALNYWPLTPLRTSLLLSFVSYLLYQFIVAHLNRDLNRKFVIENLVVSVLAFLMIVSFF
jgi:hypothetical protein